MNPSKPPDVVRKMIVVRCPIDIAFRVWTEQIDRWWPKGHSRSGEPGTLIFLEHQVGGRLYERTTGGAEYTWGRVLIWEPPLHLAYSWYLGSSAEQPTRVDVLFRSTAEGFTQLDLTHRGPELIGDLWVRTNARFAAAWEHVLASYDMACASLEQENT